MKAKTVNKINGISAIVVFAVVLLFGIAFLVGFLALNKKIPENFVETEAKIVKIQKELSPTADETDGLNDDDYEYTVFVEYSYEGETFSEVEYPKYSSSMKEGDTVKLFVNPEKPSEFMADKSGEIGFIIAGIVAILIGAGGLGFNIYKRKKGE